MDDKARRALRERLGVVGGPLAAEVEGLMDEVQAAHDGGDEGREQALRDRLEARGYPAPPSRQAAASARKAAATGEGGEERKTPPAGRTTDPPGKATTASPRGRDKG